MSEFDHCKPVRHLVKSLDEAGDGAAAQLLRSSLTTGSIGAEVFMALRFHLANLLQQHRLPRESLGRNSSARRARRRSALDRCEARLKSVHAIGELVTLKSVMGHEHDNS